MTETAQPLAAARVDQIPQRNTSSRTRRRRLPDGLTKLCILIALAYAMAGAVLAGPVGSTSQWGIVVQPCTWCGGTNGIEVHHIYPQHLWPDRARDTNNMVCLCRRCHFVLGHRCNFTNAVTNIVRMFEEGKR